MWSLGSYWGNLSCSDLINWVDIAKQPVLTSKLDQQDNPDSHGHSWFVNFHKTDKSISKLHLSDDKLKHLTVSKIVAPCCEVIVKICYCRYDSVTTLLLLCVAINHQWVLISFTSISIKMWIDAHLLFHLWAFTITFWLKKGNNKSLITKTNHSEHEIHLYEKTV